MLIADFGDHAHLQGVNIQKLTWGQSQRVVDNWTTLREARVVIADFKDEPNRRRDSDLGSTPGPLRCHLYPPMNDSRSPWTSSRGQVS
jgi:sorbitol-specific phosphotransferase system component IIBC